MSEVNLAEPIQAPKPDRGLAVRGLFEVFTQPSNFFTKLKDNPKILLPYMVIAAMTLVFFLLTADLIVEMQVNHPKFLEQIPAGTNVEQMKPMLKGSVISFGTITILLMPLVAAALAIFWGNFVFAGRSSFSRVLSATLYGEVLYIFGSFMLILPLVLAKGNIGASFSPAVLVADQGIESPLYTALSKLSVFHIWEIIALGIGYSIIFGFSRGKGYATALLSVGLMAVFHVFFSFMNA